jgi:RNA-directed DNA polymerase
MVETSSSVAVSTKPQRIAERSRASPEMPWTTLAHHIDIEWLRAAYRRTRKDGATGVNRVTAAEYVRKLNWSKMHALLERLRDCQEFGGSAWELVNRTRRYDVQHKQDPA